MKLMKTWYERHLDKKSVESSNWWAYTVYSVCSIDLMFNNPLYINYR